MKEDTIKIIRAAAYYSADYYNMAIMWAQKDAMLKFNAQNPNICFVESYQDIGSRTGTSQPPMFYGMIHDALISKRFEVIVVQDISRLSRNSSYLVGLLSELKKNGIEVYSIAERRTLNSLTDEMEELLNLLKEEEYAR